MIKINLANNRVCLKLGLMSLIGIILLATLSCTAVGHSTARRQEEVNNRERQRQDELQTHNDEIQRQRNALHSCINTCLNHYAIAQKACQYLVAGEKDRATQHDDYYLCLENKGFLQGENSCRKGCQENTSFYLDLAN